MNGKKTNKEIRKSRVRRKLKNNKERARLTVFRSSKHIYAQIINDLDSKTLVSASTLSKELKTSIKKTADITAAVEVGKLIAKKAIAAKIEKVAFDRGSYLYHGRVKALADAARQEGLQF